MIFLDKIETVEKWPFLVVIFGGIAITLFFNWIYRSIQNRRITKFKIFPRYTIKQIAIVSIMIGISIAFVSILVGTTPIAAFPQVRTAIEALLIKIIGLFFGASIGFTAGILTDGLTSLFFPFQYHWGYTLMVGSYGLLAGMIKFLKDHTSRNNWLFVWSNLGILLALMIGAIGLTTTADPIITLYITKSNHIDVKKWVICGIFLGIITIPILSIIGSWIIFKNKRMELDNFHAFCSIVILATLSEFFITTLMATRFDSDIFNVPYVPLAMSKFLFMPFKIVINTAIIFITYLVIKPLIRRSIRDMENKKVLESQK